MSDHARGSRVGAIPARISRRLGAAVILFGVLMPATAEACAPVVPLVRLFGLSLYALPLTVVVKAVAFARFERSVRWPRAMLVMAVANVVSSVVGVSLSLAPASPSLALAGLLAVAAVSIVPARRIVAVSSWPPLARTRPDVLACGLVVLYVVTAILFFRSAQVLDAVAAGVRPARSYWLAKLAYLYPALALGIGLTTLWEEWIVAAMLRHRRDAGSFLPAVLRANLVAFVLVLALGAGVALPVRLQSPEFLYFGQLLRWLVA